MAEKSIWVASGRTIVGPSQETNPSSVQLAFPSRISAGDFYDLGKEICLIGVGQGTNMEAAVECMTKNYLDHQYVAIVKDCFDWNPSRKYLENICNIVSSNKAIVLESVANATRHRLVDIFKRVGTEYKLWVNSVDFVDFLKLNLQFEVEIVAELKEAANPAVQLSADRVKFPDVPTAWPTNNPSVQTTNTVLMVSPMNFCYNFETAQDNSFMKTLDISADQLKYKVLEEFSALVNNLANEGINVHVVLNDTPGTPDAVFPNNWFSTHCTDNKRTLALYSMKSESRRKERNPVIIQRLAQNYPIVQDYVSTEANHQILEGTGALVLDHIHRVAYVVESQRADREVAEKWAKEMGYSLVLFKAVDKNGQPIYHTNVVMSVGTNVAILCDECIPDLKEREAVVESLKKTHEIVTISYDQMNNFAGNALELLGKNGLVVLLSKTAFDSLNPNQRNIFEKHQVKLVPSDINVLETIGGGSVRCCIAQLF